MFKLKKAFLLLCSFLPNIADAAYSYHRFSSMSRFRGTRVPLSQTQGSVCAFVFLSIIWLLLIVCFITTFNLRIENKQSKKEKKKKKKKEIAKPKPKEPLIRSIEEFKKQKKNKK
jgi:Na+-transporting methylmalonyl-CoA/oxaloacetate decarboxylase gamma subunit